MLDRNRLKLECRQMSRFPWFRDFKLKRHDGTSDDEWWGLYWTGYAPTGHHLYARYPEEYPSDIIKVWVKPALPTRHKHYDRNVYGYQRLCFMDRRKWSPDFTVAKALSQAICLIHDVQAGRTK